ncbi:MAG: tryptophan synthase subunit alpha [Chloroflexi bacterium]|nr:tryptophan synthase subunit alpha [Chloroflexota bacterium]
MSRIAQRFATLRAAKRPALIPFLTIGYPDLDTTVGLAPGLAAGGADLIELGIPFSDPLADGATIQRASFRALEQGVTVASSLATAAKIRRTVDIPLCLMAYYNPIYRFGPDRFCAAASEAGVDGLIVVDLPPEEAEELEKAAIARELDVILLATPTSTEERIQRICSKASGFVYCVSVAGVTGARDELPAGLAEFVQRVRQRATTPVVVGFGISKPKHFSAVARIADGAVVGSALIDLIEHLPYEQRPEGAREFLQTMRKGADEGQGGEQP